VSVIGNPGFSLLLNQPISESFDTIIRKKNDYLFCFEGNVRQVLHKNQSEMVVPNVDFMNEDHNPFNIKIDHPDLAFIQYDLGGKSRQKWVNQFRNAYRFIQNHAPDIFLEITPFLNQIVPLGYDPGKQNSSSYTSSPGILYLSYTDMDIIQAEALVHETSHTIYNIIEKKGPLLNNDLTLQYYSVSRPDARHLRGCLLGLHAFINVEHLYHELSRIDSIHHWAFLKCFTKNQIQIQVIEKHALFSPEGRLFFSDIKKRFAQHIPLFKKIRSVNPTLVQEASLITSGHFKKAKAENTVLLY